MNFHSLNKFLMAEFFTIFELIIEERIKELKSYLALNKDSLQKLADSQGYTLIHTCAVHEKESILDLLLRFVQVI